MNETIKEVINTYCDNCCWKCKYWDQISEDESWEGEFIGADFGSCTRMPPSFTGGHELSPGSWNHPVTYEDASCGEFSKRQDDI